MAFFILWFLFSMIVGAVASAKGHSGFLFFLLALLLSPLLGLIIALVLPSDSTQSENELLASGARRKCPKCAELVRAEATVCKHCQHSFSAAPELEHTPKPQ